jgi:hypothetical protein
MIDGLIMDPFDVSEFAFELKPESFWNRSTAAVVGGAMNLDPMQSDVETVRGDGLDGSCHIAAAFEFAGDPVADGGPTVGEKCSVKSDDADDPSDSFDGDHDRPVPAAVPSGSDIPAFDRSLDEPCGVRDRPGERHPGKTCSQPGSIAVHELEDLGGVFRSEGFQTEIVTDSEGYDGGDGAHRADYTLGPDGGLDPVPDLKNPWAACKTNGLLEFDMVPVLISNAIWLVVCLTYGGLYFWQAGKDRKNGTGYLEED